MYRPLMAIACFFTLKMCNEKRESESKAPIVTEIIFQLALALALVVLTISSFAWCYDDGSWTWCRELVVCQAIDLGEVFCYRVGFPCVMRELTPFVIEDLYMQKKLNQHQPPAQSLSVAWGTACVASKKAIAQFVVEVHSTTGLKGTRRPVSAFVALKRYFV